MFSLCSIPSNASCHPISRGPGDRGIRLPADSVLEASRGADILFHEVIGVDDRDKAPWGKTTRRNKHAALGDVSRFFHTTTEQLAALAKEAEPKLLVLYHAQNWSKPYEAEALVEEIRRFGYSGRVINGRDQDIF